MDTPTESHTSASIEALRTAIEKHWGYRTFRPLQEEAMRATLARRDSLVVLPTGGGKSLCYQAPALVRAGTTVVVSPLISLMKDQVDALRSNGIAAAQIDSSMSPDDRRAVEYDVREGALRLLFVSPERLVTAAFQDFLRDAGVTCFAIDEAHCISHWGHDFRPEYRQLGRIKEWFPGASVHAFTATATERVREDIAAQLQLSDAEVLVGNFDRPNLIYRVVARRDETRQVIEVLDRHKGDAGIVYCIRRKDVDGLTAALVAKHYKARAYHAGMTSDQRRAAQEAFAAEGCDLIVATVAFGMGIDRSNIRFVMHTGMPKSIEAYQQETGRAGRDGLEAECVLLYSGQDAMVWKSIVEKSAAEARAAGTELDPEFVPVALRHIDDMDRYARGAVCRHQALVEYFGQHLEAENCAACDVCLGDRETVPDGLIIAQKILSCVARVKERFGIVHVIGVLRGANTERVRTMGHDKLPTYGLLSDKTDGELRDWIYQLVGQKVLVQETMERNGQSYPILKLNEASWEVMRSQRDVRLVQPVRKEKLKRATRDEAVSWEGVDQELFEALRGMRRQLALERNVQPYVIFSDATLRELARVRPSSLERMRLVYGIGERKLRDFGERVLEIIRSHSAARGLTPEGTPAATTASVPPAKIRKAVAGRSNGVDQELFDKLRALRRQIVAERPGAAQEIMPDAALQTLARLRPTRMRHIIGISGIREAGGDVAVRIADLIRQHCRAMYRAELEPVALEESKRPAAEASVRPPLTEARQHAFEMFRSGAGLDDVAAAIQQSRNTAAQYLVEFIRSAGLGSIAAWVPERVYREVAEVTRQLHSRRPAQVFQALGEAATYEQVRFVLAHLDAVK